MNKLFSKKDAIKITGLSYQFLYDLDTRTNLVSPEITIDGSNEKYYTYTQLVCLILLKYIVRCGIHPFDIVDIHGLLSLINEHFDLLNNYIIIIIDKVKWINIKSYELEKVLIDLTSFENNNCQTVTVFSLFKFVDELDKFKNE